MANIGVLGLGYVGIVNTAGLTKNGHTVYCSDVKPLKVQQVKEGKSPILEPKVDDLLKAALDSNKLFALATTAEVVSNSEVLFICVGTPSQPNGEVNLNYLRNCCLEIQKSLKPSDSKTVVFRSTVPPGTTEQLKLEYFHEFKNVSIVFYPEFLREGSAMDDYFNYGRMVLGSDEKDLTAILEIVHINPEAPVFCVDFKTAEFTKYADNGFHALKVAFANEIFGLASILGTDVEKSYEIFISDSKLNISPYYFRPGMPFGGSCLPKDLRETQFLTNKVGNRFTLLNNIINSNEKFIEDILQRILESGKRKIGIIGFTFKNYSDDLRESPILKVVESLLGSSDFEIKIWDEDMNELSLRIDYPHLFPLLSSKEEIAEQELIIVTKRYLDLITTLNTKGIIYNFSDKPYSTSSANCVPLYGKH